MPKLTRPKTGRTVRSDAPSSLWLISQKLRGLGLLLERFGLDSKNEKTGFNGVGILIAELGEEVGEIVDQLAKDSSGDFHE